MRTLKLLSLACCVYILIISQTFANTSIKSQNKDKFKNDSQTTKSEMTLTEFNRKFDILDNNDTEYENQISSLNKQLMDAVKENNPSKKNLVVMKSAGLSCTFLENTREARKLIAENPELFKQTNTPLIRRDIVENINDREEYLNAWLTDLFQDASIINYACKDLKDVFEKIK